VSSWMVNYGFQISHAQKKGDDKHSVVSLWQGGTKSCAWAFLLTLFQSCNTKSWIESLGCEATFMLTGKLLTIKDCNRGVLWSWLS